MDRKIFGTSAVGLTAALLFAAPNASAGGPTGGALEPTQMMNNIQLIAQVSEAVDTTANTLLTAQQTMQMLKNLPDTIRSELLSGLPVDKVQALAQSYQTFAAASSTYKDAQKVLEDAYRDMQALKMKPAEYLDFRIKAAKTLGGVYQDQYETEVAKLNRLKDTSLDIQKQAMAIHGINSQVSGLQAIATQNVQMQTFLGDISSSIAQANANAAMEKEKKEKEFAEYQKNELEERKKGSAIDKEVTKGIDAITFKGLK